MVVSKKCKICSAADESNIPISGECFGKSIPELLGTICGLELDPRKLNGVLVCQLCSIMIMHTDCFVTKLRKSMSRLQKPNKAQRTPKMASKRNGEAGSETKKKVLKKDSNTPNGEVVFKKITDEKKTPTKIDDQDTASETPLNNTKRKLAYHEEVSNKVVKPVNTKKETKQTPASSDSILTYLENNYNSQEELSGETNANVEVESNAEEASVPPKDEESKKIKKVTCVICGKTFNQKRALREHIEFSHMGEKLKECPNCFMEFRSVQKYESHVFNEKCKTTLYPCQFENCNKRFKNSHKMEDHMKEKHFASMITEIE